MQANPSDFDHLGWLKAANIDSFKGLRLLDLGCGSGYICHKAMDEGAKSAVGIDVVQPNTDVRQTNGWQFLSTDLNAEDWHAGFAEQFDLILAFDIVEHLDSPYRFLSSCLGLLSSSGKIVVTTPNLLSWERFHKPKDWSGVRDPQHKVLFTKYSLNFLLRKVGFGAVELSAPMRSFSFLGPLQPQIGGQILCVAAANGPTAF